MRLAFVDLETTGASAGSDRITEIGVVEVDEGGTREWSSLVNPGVRIPEFIERLTGISNGMVATAPRFEELAPALAERLEGRIFVAHNARFDYGFLKAEFARLQIPFRAQVVCTVKLSRRLYPAERKHNLDSLIARHGLAIDQRHRALGDARAIAQFWQQAREAAEPSRWQEAIDALLARPALPPQLEAMDVDALPSGAGVYLFYGENDLPLYIGKSRQVRKRVLSHFTRDTDSDKEAALVRQVRRIECIPAAGETGALLLEARLVKQLRPLHNRLLRQEDELCSWLWNPAEDAPPRLVRDGEIDLGRQPDLHGLFRSPREAKRALQALVDENGLCAVTVGLERVTAGRACAGYQLRRCRGACLGKESPRAHAARLAAAFSRLRLPPWPHPGPALLREGDAVHVIDGWRHLGTAANDAELEELLRGSPPPFDRDIFLLLRKQKDSLVPLPARRMEGSDEFR